jgi:TolB-like protein/ketosteroid isomerase-like protein
MRRIVVVSLGAVVATAGGYLLWPKPPKRADDTGQKPVTAKDQPPPTVVWPMAIGVMEIAAKGETPEWMCDITHQGLNALLSKFDKLKVFSKDMIDWKKEKTGMKSFDIAKDLGVTRMINGELIRSGVNVTLQVRIVDTQTGQQIDTCEATGTEDKLVDIQNDVGLKLVRALKVPITKTEIDKVLTARTNVDLDVTKRFAEAFGGEEEAPPPPKNAPGTSWLWSPSEAHAQAADEQGVKQLLERYRAALEAKNLDQLAAIYVSLSDNTREALTRYFQSANDLKVQFSGVNVLFEGDEALATFTRSDNFKDVQTGRDVNLEVRVSTVVAKADGGWKIKALRKPS